MQCVIAPQYIYPSDEGQQQVRNQRVSMRRRLIMISNNEVDGICEFLAVTNNDLAFMINH
jgi:hypothetical protein